MDLSATDVENKEFSEARKGYVREQVDSFLDQVAAQFRRYDERLTTMAQRIAALESELGQTRETEEMARRMLLVAQRAAEEAVADAEERAQAVVQQAEQRAVAAEEESRRRLAALESEIGRLRRFEADFRAQLRQALESQLAVLQRTGPAASETPAGDAHAASEGLPPERAHPTAAGVSGPVQSGPGGAPQPVRAGMPQPVRPGPVRVADNEVLRRLAEGGRRNEPSSGTDSDH